MRIMGNLRQRLAADVTALGLPPGPERTQVYELMARLVAVYAPWKPIVHRKRNQVRRPEASDEFWQDW